MGVPLVAGVGHLAGRDLQCREQAGRAVADVVVGGFLRQPGPDRQRSGRCGPAPAPGFSRRRRPRPRSRGGLRYSPTTSRTFASSSGSVENLNVSRRHGCSFHSRQIRATDANEIPRCLPSSRADQCVTPSESGGPSSVATTTATSSITGGRPDRSRSCSDRDPAALVPRPPADHRRARHPDLTGDLGVRQPLGRQQHDPRPLRQPGLSRRRTQQRRQPRLVTGTQNQRGNAVRGNNHCRPAALSRYSGSSPKGKASYVRLWTAMNERDERCACMPAFSSVKAALGSNGQPIHGAATG